MKDSKIRLYQYIIDNIEKLHTIKFTPKEIKSNIEFFGVYVDGQIIYKRLFKVFGNEIFDLTHWPKREEVSYDGIAIIWEDDDFLLLFKPFGLPVQSGTGHIDHNLVNWLIENVEGQRELLNTESNENNVITAGLVHRLDKDTQGLILIAKTLPALIHAQNQFRTRFVSKTYLTFVNGKIDDEITVEGHQYRDPNNMIKQIFLTNKTYEAVGKRIELEGIKIKDCKTVITPLLTDNNRTFCKVKIFTGRMHQIRLACQAIGHCIVNDKVYNNIYSKLSEIDQHTFFRKEFLPKKIDTKELDLIVHNVFKGHKYCLLSNEIIFKDMKDQVISKKLNEY
jgi:23S rRNA pseudouridine1911/1915/1917 synthase